MPGRHIVHVRALKVKKRATDSFQVELQAVVNAGNWTWGSSVRAVYILNRWVTPPFLESSAVYVVYVCIGVDVYMSTPS